VKPAVAALVGPTAAGKTEVALDVADALGAEIVSADSMQIYRGMDIGTAKPSAEQRARVRHHLIGELEPSHAATVEEFQKRARAAIDDIVGRGVLPLIVGGSGLYFRAIVDDLRFPPRAPEVRRALEDEAEVLGAEALHERLSELDPVAASRIDSGNARRTVRALEVIEITGTKFSDNDSWDGYESIYDLTAAGLLWPRDELHARIEKRVDVMLAGGLVDEARRLDQEGLGVTARHALGYRQVLEAGDDASDDEVRDDIVRATKRFARRQESWFRSDPRIVWFDAMGADLIRQVVAFYRRGLDARSRGRR
jgi:tRNA dimethylallyltransferase